MRNKITLRSKRIVYKLYDFYINIMEIKFLLHAHDKRLLVLSQQSIKHKNIKWNKIILWNCFVFFVCSCLCSRYIETTCIFEWVLGFCSPIFLYSIWWGVCAWMYVDIFALSRLKTVPQYTTEQTMKHREYTWGGFIGTNN